MKLNIYVPFVLAIRPKRKKKHIYTKDLHTIVYSPKLETTQMSTNKKMDQKIVVHLYNSILSNQKKGNDW